MLFHPTVIKARSVAKPFILLVALTAFSNSLLSQAPIIQDFLPKSGSAGTLVFIIGSNLGDANTSTVYFGAGLASVVESKNDTLIVRVPKGATYAPIQVIRNGQVANTATPFALTFANSNPILSTTSYQDEKKLAAGVSTRTVLIADLNRDSLTDIIASNLLSRNVTVFQNLGSNEVLSFSPQTITGIGTSNIWSAVPADLNGDGWLDLIVVSSSGGMLVLTNAGTSPQISFSAPQTFATGLGTQNRTATAADVDGDGKLDIIAAGDTKVVVLRNTGNGAIPAFAAPVTFTVGQGAQSLAIADLNGDGKQDIACALQLPNAFIYVLPNQSTPGNIQMATALQLPAIGLNRVCALDVDGDGKVDLATNNFDLNSISIYRNTSTAGSLSFAAPINFSGPNFGTEITAANVNGDSKPDIIASSQGDQTVSVFANQSTPGTISFQAVQKYFTTGSSYAVTAGDINGDGRPDILSANPGNPTPSVISVFLNAIGSYAEFCPGSSLSITAPVSGSSYQWYTLTDTGYAVLENDPAYIGVNSRTLSSTSALSEWSGTKLSCKVDGVFTSPIELISLNIWTGLIDNDYLKPGNWSCGVVPDLYSTIVVSSGTVKVSTTQTVGTIRLSSPGKIEVAPGAQLIISKE